MECSLCCEAFEEEPEARVPRLLPCGHTFCQGCLERLAGASGTGAVRCPSRCAAEGRLGAEGVAGLPRNFALIESLRAERAPGAQGDSELARLLEEKRRAVEDEDYDLAKRLKAQIDALSGGPDPTCVARCFDLGGLGRLLQVRPSATSALPWRRPSVVCVLDRSPSMGQTVQWAVNCAMPQALQRLGYPSTDAVALITFDSVAERVQLGGRDPTVGELRTINVKARGRTTLMAQAVELLGQALSAGGAFNVFVISDGFLKDMAPMLRRAEAEIERVPSSARVAFALFRFFNGAPPDTQALAASASLGTVGGGHCTDCVVRRELLEQAMADFVTTAEAAFGGTMGKHAVVDGAGFRRLPNMAESRRVEVPCDSETVLLISRPVEEIRINGRRVVLDQLVDPEPAIAAFCAFALAQLRLWLVGQVRQDDFTRAAHWFRQLAETRGRGTSECDTSIFGRAAALRCRRAGDETPLARIEALAGARAFMAELNSKQQGDFLQGGSVGRADRLLARRGLGSDIVYHDAVRYALRTAAASSSDAAAADTEREARGEEVMYASSYGGGEYRDVLRASAHLAPLAEDLSVAEVLQVVGGVGLAFSATLPSEPNNPWALEVTGVDVGHVVAESDVWAAGCAGAPLRVASGCAVAGVVPLADCGAAAHEAYFRGPLRPVAFMQLASQLRGALPEKTWGWDAHSPPFAFEDGVAAREAAVLCFLAAQGFGDRRAPSATEADLAAKLLAQLREWPGSGTPAASLPSGAQGAMDLGSSSLRRFAAVFAAGEEVSPALARELCDAEIRCFLQKVCDAHGLPTHALDARRWAVISLLARDASAQATAVSGEAVHQRFARLLHDAAAIAGGNDSEDGQAPRHDDSVVADARLAERLCQQPWLPPTDLVLGAARILRSAVRRGAVGAVAPAAAAAAEPPLTLDAALFGSGARGGAAAAFVAAAAAHALIGASTDQSSFLARTASLQETQQELRRLLRQALEGDYQARLHKALAQLMTERREEAKRLRETSRSSSAEGPEEELVLEAIFPDVPVGWGQAGEQPHIACAFCGEASAGKSTAAGRLLYELGSVSRAEMTKCQAEAARLGREASAFAFVFDHMKKERESGLSVSVRKSNFYTDRWHYTVLDCPGRQSYLRNALVGFAQADVGVLCVPADGRLGAAIARGNHRLGEPQGGARQHARLLLVCGISQLIVCVTKMDSKTAAYAQARFEEATAAVKEMLVQVGWKRDVVDTRIPFIPLAAFAGGNLVRPSERMPWWRGCTVRVGEAGSRNVTTLAAALNTGVVSPMRAADAPFRMPITGVFKIKGAGDVVTGRIAQGAIDVGQEVAVGPSGGPAKVFSCEMHHRSHAAPRAGDIVGLNLKGLRKERMPRVGDVLFQPSCKVEPVRSFTATIQVLDIPNCLRPNWAPICFAHTVQATVRLTKIAWRMGRGTGGARVEDPRDLRSGDMASVEFSVLGSSLTLEPFEKMPAFGRIILADGNVSMAVGKVIATQTSTGSS